MIAPLPLRSATRHGVWCLALAVVAGCGGTSGDGSGSGEATQGTDGGGSTGDTTTADSGDTGSQACFPASLQDDFSGPSLDTQRWLVVDTSGMQPELVDGRLTFVPTPDWTEAYWATVRPVDNVDLGECASWMEAARMLPEGVIGEVIWEAQFNADEYAMIRVGQPDIQFLVNGTSEGLEQSTLPYDETAHRWWRYRDEAGVFHLETSPDQDTWTVQLEHAHDPEWDLSSVRLSFKASASADIEFDGPQFDNVNVTY